MAWHVGTVSSPKACTSSTLHKDAGLLPAAALPPSSEDRVKDDAAPGDDECKGATASEDTFEDSQVARSKKSLCPQQYCARWDQQVNFLLPLSRLARLSQRKEWGGWVDILENNWREYSELEKSDARSLRFGE